MKSSRWIRRRSERLGFYHGALRSKDAESCILWPFGRTSTGYAAMWVSDGNEALHRKVLFDTVGPPPDGRPLALHNPDCEARSCINPSHLRWGSYLENSMDRWASETMHYGESHPTANLSDDQIDQIRSAYIPGKTTQDEIAIRFGISQTHVSKIFRGKRRAKRSQ